MSNPETATAGIPAGPNASLANRYGRPKRSLSKRAVALLAAVGVLVLVLAALFLSVRSQKSFSTTDVAFDIVSERQVDVTVAVTLDEGHSVTCGVQALSEDKAIVGYKDVVFDAADGQDAGGKLRTVQITVPLRTVFAAVNGGMHGCREN
ncbi:DUF4307 domain-containing protein [Galactobacter valiniphilus]|uniref:DUF4307 domain-containing protein n=1 Tax=Galactobacter valiniphilus TaxID=2676122 RepID=UPI0037365570